jgi:serine/threonine protein kinase
MGDQPSVGEKGNMTLPELPDLLIEEELGRGGMGVVYKGYQTLLDRYVAVKFLNVDNAEASVRDRFRREARVLASLSHPNIVACHSAGTDDGGRLYLIMEYVDGPSLQDYITKQGPLRPVVALALIQQIATALEYALTQGIIHRDIKPETIRLSDDPTHLLLHVAGGAAVFLDLTLHRPIQ